MGLLRAIVTLVLSMTIINGLLRYKETLEEYPIVRHLVALVEKKKCYVLIGIMLLITTIW